MKRRSDTADLFRRPDDGHPPRGPPAPPPSGAPGVAELLGHEEVVVGPARSRREGLRRPRPMAAGEGEGCPEPETRSPVLTPEPKLSPAQKNPPNPNFPAFTF